MSYYILKLVFLFPTVTSLLIITSLSITEVKQLLVYSVLGLIIIVILLRQLKMAILSFSEIFLKNNGPVADFRIQLLIPLI